VPLRGGISDARFVPLFASVLSEVVAYYQPLAIVMQWCDSALLGSSSVSVLLIYVSLIFFRCLVCVYAV